MNPDVFITIVFVGIAVVVAVVAVVFGVRQTRRDHARVARTDQARQQKNAAPH